MYEEYESRAYDAASEVCELSGIKKGQILVVGCSTSEVMGDRIGSNSVPEIAEAVYSGIDRAAREHGVYIAAQCCEHLNRAIIIERSAVSPDAVVNVVPQPKAGGSFATAAWKIMSDPVAVERIKADAGMDIGDTLIGMHLKEVAVPVRLKTDRIGEARVVAARVRPKYIGGPRAQYDDKLM